LSAIPQVELRQHVADARAHGILADAQFCRNLVILQAACQQLEDGEFVLTQRLEQIEFKLKGSRYLPLPPNVDTGVVVITAENSQ
jgi:hypothetical protein